MREMPIDSSLAFSAQLELRPGLTSTEGDQWRALLLADWYQQDKVLSFWDFARGWHPAPVAMTGRERFVADVAYEEAGGPRNEPAAWHGFITGWQAAMDRAAAVITKGDSR